MQRRRKKQCTAVGFYFALRLHAELGCPIGLIDCNWGGSKVEEWIPECAMNTLSEATAANAREFVTHARTDDRKFIGCMYNSKMNPWTKYTIQGAIWYQGCSNGGQGLVYFEKMEAMIQALRKALGYDFPFYWVQLANFQAPSDDANSTGGFVPVRAHNEVSRNRKDGQAVIIRCRRRKDIHPITSSTSAIVWRLRTCERLRKRRSVASAAFRLDEVKEIKRSHVENVGAGPVVRHQEPPHIQHRKRRTLKRFAVAVKMENSIGPMRNQSAIR